MLHIQCSLVVKGLIVECKQLTCYLPNINLHREVVNVRDKFNT